MYRVLVGGISPEGEHLLTSYLEKFIPDAEIEPLKPAGIKGRMKNHAVKPDVLMVILDTGLWDTCVGTVDAVLALPKVHRYESDEGLREFLESKFGPLDDIGGTGTVPPDVLMGQMAREEDDGFVAKNADLAKDSATGATVPPDQLEAVAPAMVDDELPTTDESEDVSSTDAPSEVVEKLNGQIRDLQSKLTGKEALIRSLTLQLNDKTQSDQDDISALVGRIRELEQEVADKDAQLSNSDSESYVNLGKVARAEQVLGEFDDLKQKVKQADDARVSVEKERDKLSASVKSLEAEIGGLREQVSHIPELEQSIAEKTKRVSALELEISEKASQVEALESQLGDSQGVALELSQLRAEFDVLQKQIEEDKERLKRLDDLEDELSAKQLTIDNLQVDIRTLNETIEGQSSDISRLKGELQTKVADLETVHKELEDVREDLREKSAELAEVVAARDEALAHVSESSDYSKTLMESTQSLTQQITQLTEELSAKSAQLDIVGGSLQEAENDAAELRQQLEGARSELAEQTERCDGLLQQLEDLRDQFDKKSEECEDLRTQLRDKTDECAGLTNQLETLQASSSSSIDAVRLQLEAKDTEIAELRGSLNTKDATVTKLTGDISSLHEQLANSTTELTTARTQLEDTRKKLLDAQSAGDAASISAQTQQQALDKVLEEKQELEDKLVASEAKCMDYEGRMRTMESDLTQERAYRTSIDASNVELSAQNEKLVNTVQQLEENLVKAKTDEEMVTRLEAELLEERRRTARLQSEVDVLKRTSGTDKASDLRVEIVRLKKELDEVRESTVDASEAERAKAELAEAREHAAKLELELVEKDNQIGAISANVFSQLRNIAIPKGAYDLKLPALQGLSDKFLCVASGSEESTANVYQVLRSACTANGTKRVVLVDLVTDSSVDKEFGIKKIVSPIPWLAEGVPFRQFIADTRYGHVKVLSTALAYINDLFLMTVDWQRCLAELDAFSADTIILYVGCLNNLATKVLFDMFSKAMKSYVIVKATPVNLRTTILNLTGFKDLSPLVSVECVNFSDTSSAAMYQRLVAKYKAHILRDTEVLQL